MLTGLLTAISVLSSGYTFAKRVLDDTKNNRPEAYEQLKKVPRSQRRKFLDKELVEHSKKLAREELIKEMKEEYKKQIRKEMYQEIKNEAEDVAWEQVKTAIKTDPRALKELSKLSSKNGKNE